jgi:hypothetical protein
MSSQQKTAEYFKDKSDQEIIDWMLKNLSTEQIRSCLGDDTITTVQEPVQEPVQQTELCKPEFKESFDMLNSIIDVQKKMIPTNDNVKKIIKFAPILIESINIDKTNKDNSKINYYYLEFDETTQEIKLSGKNDKFGNLIDVKSVKYSDFQAEFGIILKNFEKIQNFIKITGQTTKPNSQTINEWKQDIRVEVNKYFNKSANQNDRKNIIINYINSFFIDFLFTSYSDILNLIVDEQRQIIPTNEKVKKIINFTPVLIESFNIKTDRIKFYYLNFDEDTQTIKLSGTHDKTGKLNNVTYVTYNEFKIEFQNILDNFEKIQNYISEPGTQASSSSKTVDEWKEIIKLEIQHYFTETNKDGELVNEEDKKNIIKIYNLSIGKDKKTYFMDDLFSSPYTKIALVVDGIITLDTIIKEQRKMVPTNEKVKQIIKFTPILIESFILNKTNKDNSKIKYYYLEFDEDTQTIKLSGTNNTSGILDDVKEIKYSDFQTEFKSILDNFEKIQNYISEPGTQASSSSKTVYEWKKIIKDKINEYFDKTENEKDKKRIMIHYDNNYFIEDLFSKSSNFGKIISNNDIINFGKNHFGDTFHKLFKSEIKTNNYGFKTIHYIPR